jgi:hypothetical protein
MRLVHIALILLFNCGLYGGAFLYSLMHYRILKRQNWIKSIGYSIFWMIIYAFLVVLLSLFLINENIILLAGITGMISIFQYIYSIRLYIRSKHA